MWPRETTQRPEGIAKIICMKKELSLSIKFGNKFDGRDKIKAKRRYVLYKYDMVWSVTMIQAEGLLAPRCNRKKTK